MFHSSCSMFFLRLMSFSSSFRPRGRPAPCRANSRSGVAFSSSNLQQFIPASHPWWSVQGFPPWPPQLLHHHPPVRLFSAGRTFQPFNVSRGGWCSLHASAGRMMECPDREYFNKRLKNSEEKGGHAGGGRRETRGKAEEGESKRPHHHVRVGNHEQTKSRGERLASRDTSREKHVEWSQSEKKGSRDGTQSQHLHPAGSRTQTPKSKPVPDQVPLRPNPWFKRKAEEELGGDTGPAEQLQDGGGAAKWTGHQSNPSSTSPTSTVWRSDQVHRPSPLPGILLPVKRTEEFLLLILL